MIEEADVPGHEHPDLTANIEELAAAVMGPVRSEFAGGGRYADEGLVHKVDDLYDTVEAVLAKLNNGGIKIKLPWQVWVAIITAVTGLIAQLLGVPAPMDLGD